jgi:hypothetical protein
VLAVDAQRDPAGGQDPQGRTRGQQPYPLDQLLEVVQDEEQFPVRQRSRQAVFHAW